MPDKHKIPLYLFAKEPVAGQVKTRLAPALGHQRCAQLATQMLQQSAEQVSRHWQGRLVLCVTPRTDAPLFLEMTEELQCGVALQQGQDLGERMRNVLDAGIQHAGASVVMGCDVPHISAEVLRQAFDVLKAGHNVVGPAEDGGFYIMGLHKPVAGLFDDVVWGGSQVLSKVMENAAHCGAKFMTLPTMRDIDLWDDLVWLAQAESRYLRYTEFPFNSEV